MTTPQLPPLPEPHSVLYVDENTGGYSEYQRQPVTLTEADVPAYTADQMRAYALASLSTRPVAESIHEANARTLQALVDELREMLGVKEGESLKDAVRALSASAAQSDTSGMWCIHIPGPNEVHAAPNETIAHYMASRHNAAMAAFYAKSPAEDDCSPSVKSTLATAIKWPHDAESHAQEMSEFDWNAWGLVAPIKKEQEA